MVKYLDLDSDGDAHLGYENVIFLSVSTHVWMCAFLAPENLDGICSNSVSKSLLIPGLCPVNPNIRAPNRGP
jgi:hypothetical protein